MPEPLALFFTEKADEPDQKHGALRCFGTSNNANAWQGMIPDASGTVSAIFAQAGEPHTGLNWAADNRQSSTADVGGFFYQRREP